VASLAQQHILLFFIWVEVIKEQTRVARLANQKLSWCDGISLLALPENYFLAVASVNEAVSPNHTFSSSVFWLRFYAVTRLP
jgi:hypothetical protein